MDKVTSIHLLEIKESSNQINFSGSWYKIHQIKKTKYLMIVSSLILQSKYTKGYHFNLSNLIKVIKMWNKAILKLFKRRNIL
jgi:hypothetical protein